MPLAAAFYAGNPPGVLLVAGLSAMMVLAEFIAPAAGRRDRRLLRYFAGAGLIASGLAAAQLLPTAELLSHVTQRVRKCCYKQEAHNGQEPV